MNPDYDDYYSLSEYASRFTSDPYRYIVLWLSQVSVLSRIELWEERHGNSLFRHESMGALVEKVDRDELLEPQVVIDTLSLSSMFIENGNLYADIDIYYDFAGYLVQKGIVR